MTFKDDGGGFAFSCSDAKFSICASTWNTRLSQLGKLVGPVRIMTGLLPDTEYIAQILSKRPSEVFIIANSNARDNADILKKKFPNIRIALHPNINAKVVFVSPETVWLSSSDFGKTKQVESAIGLHSVEVHDRAIRDLFTKEWEKSIEL
jgi:hypothetical protein